MNHRIDPIAGPVGSDPGDHTDKDSSRPIPPNNATVRNESMLAIDVADARVGKRAAPKTPAAKDKAEAARTRPDQGQVVDMLAAEDSKLDAKLKTICRGC